MKNKVFSYAIVFMLIAFLFTSILLNIDSLWYFLTSDMYGDIWVSKLMWEQKTILPDNWGFGNQIYILAPPNLCALIYGMSGNLLLSMGLTSSIFLILFVISYWWAFKAIFSSREIAVSLLVFFSSFVAFNVMDSAFGQLYISGCSYYTCYAMTLLVTLGTYIRLTRDCTIKKHIVPIVLALILSYAMGIQSLRQTLIMTIPFVCLEVFRLVYCRYHHLKCNILNTYFITLSTIANVGGIVTSKILPVVRDSIYGDLAITPFQNISEKALSMVTIILKLIGIDEIVRNNRSGNVPSIDVITSIISIGILVLIILSIVKLIKCRKMYSSEIHLTNLFFIIGLLGVLATFWIIEIDRQTKYLFVFYVYLPFLSIILYQKLNEYNQHVFLYILIICSIFVYGKSYLYPYVKSKTQHTVWMDISDYLMANGYDVIYADWYDAGQIAGASRLKIIAGRWNTSEVFEIKTHTNVMGIYSEKDNDHAACVVTNFNYNECVSFLKKRNIDYVVLKSFKESDQQYRILIKTKKQVMHVR